MQLTAVPEPVCAALDELKGELQRLYGPRLAGLYLYGSYARGTARPDSDIDVLVVLEGLVSPGAEISFMGAAISDICMRHDVLIATTVISVHEMRTRNDPFLANVRSEAARL